MCGPMLLLAAASIGVDFGWQPIAGGGVEYIIQIEPELLESLASGRADIVSEIPPFLRGVRSYRITVGTGPLPHQGEPPPLQETAEPDENAGMPGPGRDPFEGAFGGLAAKPLRRPASGGDRGSDVNPAGYEEESADADERQNAGGAEGEPSQGSPGAAEGSAAGATVTAGKAAGSEEDPSPSDQASPRAEAATSRPWLPLGLALVALCASLAANAYQGWVTLALRQRYLLLLARGSQQ